MRCPDCPYWWAEEDEAPDCHYNKVAEWDLAPCEQEDRERFASEEDEALWMI